MAVRYYDDAIIEKLSKWIPATSKLRVLKPDESKRFFEITADDNKDQAFKLPLVALERNKDIELNLNIKNPRSFDGLKLHASEDNTIHFNVIPIKLSYQLNIYTKTFEEGDEYLRNFLFKLINNPAIIIDIPYNNLNIHHIANIRVLNTVSDTSDISERLFSGQFTRWTIQLEVQDAFLFSIPYRHNWTFGGFSVDINSYKDQVISNGSWSEETDPSIETPSDTAQPEDNSDKQHPIKNIGTILTEDNKPFIGGIEISDNLESQGILDGMEDSMSLADKN